MRYIIHWKIWKFETNTLNNHPLNKKTLIEKQKKSITRKPKLKNKKILPKKQKINHNKTLIEKKKNHLKKTLIEKQRQKVKFFNFEIEWFNFGFSKHQRACHRKWNTYSYILSDHYYKHLGSTGAPIWLVHSSPICMDGSCGYGRGYTRFHGRICFFFFFQFGLIWSNLVQFSLIWAKILVKKKKV